MSDTTQANHDAWQEYYKKLEEYNAQQAAAATAAAAAPTVQQQPAAAAAATAATAGSAQAYYAQYYAQIAQQQQQAYSQHYFGAAYARQQQQQQQAQQQQAQQHAEAWEKAIAARQAAAQAAQSTTVAAAPPAATQPSAAVYNSYSTYYGSAAQDASKYTQQQAGQVIGGGTPGVQQAALQVQNAVQQRAAQAAAAAAAAASSSAAATSGFQSFSVHAASQQQQQQQQLSRPTTNPQQPAAESGGGGGDGWPPTLRTWVERAFASCKSDLERSNVERNLKETIDTANRQGALWRIDWDREPLPDKGSRDRSHPPPLGRYDSYGGGQDRYGSRDWRDRRSPPRYDDRSPGRGSPTYPPDHALSKAARKRKAKAAKGVTFGHEQDYHTQSAAAQAYFRSQEDPLEEAKRQRRAGRFEASGMSLAERAGRWAEPRGVPTGVLTDGDGEFMLDYTVVGTSQTLEKKYLRLTSAPDPRTVRPEPVLRLTIPLIREKYKGFGEERGQEQYIYLWEQMKSVRQDLTVQRIRNAFTVEVYEMHARICLEFEDTTEFNQCQAQLTQLYEEGLGTAEGQREFTSYNILYNVGKQASNNVSDLMRELAPGDREDPFVRFALAVRAAEALGDYCSLFRLHLAAPGHASYVMDTFVDRVRLDAVKVLLKAYAPSVPASFVAKNLGFDTDDEAIFFLEDHGCVLIQGKGREEGGEPKPKGAVDCKASRQSLVDHSISAKEEEERKNAQRKAEIMPISFS